MFIISRLSEYAIEISSNHEKSEQKPKFQSFSVHKTNISIIIPHNNKNYLRFFAFFAIVGREEKIGEFIFFARIEKNGITYIERHGNES